MNGRFWFGAFNPKGVAESKLRALFRPIFTPVAAMDSPLALEGEKAASEAAGDAGWTAGLTRGGDLPPFRLSIVAATGAAGAMRFEPLAPSRAEKLLIAAIARAKNSFPGRAPDCRDASPDI